MSPDGWSPSSPSVPELGTGVTPFTAATGERWRGTTGADLRFSQRGAGSPPGAGEVTVGLAVEGEDLVLEVADDGMGFDPATVRGGLALGSIEYRVQDAAGE